MAEKTIEELKAELEALKKQNLEREIAVEKAKIEAEEAEKKKKEEEELREQLREEERSKLLEEQEKTKEDSKVVKETPTSLIRERANNVKDVTIEIDGKKILNNGNILV